MRHIISGITALLLLSAASGADAMWCGDRLVAIGDTKAEVVLKCGEPDYAEVVGIEKTRDRFFGTSNVVEVTVEQWIYDQGYGTFLRILTFKGGNLFRIEDGDRSPGN